MISIIGSGFVVYKRNEKNVQSMARESTWNLSPIICWTSFFLFSFPVTNRILIFFSALFEIIFFRAWDPSEVDTCFKQALHLPFHFLIFCQLFPKPYYQRWKEQLPTPHKSCMIDQLFEQHFQHPLYNMHLPDLQKRQEMHLPIDHCFFHFKTVVKGSQHHQ